MVSVDIKHHVYLFIYIISVRAEELCESRGGHPGLPVPNKPDGFCGRKATLKQTNKQKHHHFFEFVHSIIVDS